jgi:O-acetyl-ADP-ribose deacetylase (regulator of RNase III)
MVGYTTGNILDAKVDALVNTVNCVGVMGRGIALQFKQRFPDNFKAYAAACERGDVQPGRMFIFESATLDGPHFIINFPTKRHWRGKSRIENIEAGLDALVREIETRKIKSVAIPPLMRSARSRFAFGWEVDSLRGGDGF